jgi:hypothetical protein
MEFIAIILRYGIQLCSILPYFNKKINGLGNICTELGSTGILKREHNNRNWLRMGIPTAGPVFLTGQILMQGNVFEI